MVASMRQLEDLDYAKTAKTLARLEGELLEARADAPHAEALLDVAAEEAAA